MQIFYSDTFVLPLPEGHRFPMQKYAMLRRRVAESGIVAAGDLRLPPAATDEQLLRAHDGAYLCRVQRGELAPQEVRRIGFPWSPQMVERSRRSSGATIEACRAALEGGVGASLAGGTHHACSEHGEGFCIFNDSAVAARAMQAEGRARRIVVIDCDVHQGNGTAQICAGDESIFTFSIHGANNFPFRKEISDLDIGLDDGVGDDAYLSALERGLREVLDRSHADLAIYLAGADPFHDDRLGRLALTKRGLLDRDELVFYALQRAGVPLAITMAGGYGRTIEDTVDIHFQTLRAAVRL
jgi:acetoin utilization deacetylase AcuC-like enzyme